VDKRITNLEWKIPNSRKPKRYSLHRRIDDGLGSKSQSSKDDSRTLEQRGTAITHKLPRTEGDLLRASVIQRDSQPDGSNQDGQHDLRSIYQPPRQDDVGRTIKERRKTLALMSNSQDYPSSRIRFRNSQRSDRRSLSPEIR
jgi:hypothetical protein